VLATLLGLHGVGNAAPPADPVPHAPEPGAPAEPPLDLRVAVLLEEVLDGEVQPGSRAEAAMLEPLLDAGFLILDAKRLAQLRAQNAVGELLAGAALQGPHAEDVDLLVVGRVEGYKLGDNVHGTPMIRYEAAVQGKVIAADTGQVLKALSVRGQGMDVAARGSALMAMEAGGKKAAQAIVGRAGSIRAADRIVLVVATGIPNAAEAEQVAAGLARLPQVRKVTLRGKDKTSARYDVRVQGLNARTLASRVLASEGLGLQVEAYTTRRLRVSYDLRRRLKLGLLLGPFTNRSGLSEDGWLSERIPQILQTELRSAGLPTVALCPAGPACKDLRAAARERGLLLWAEGWFTNRGNKATLGMEIKEVGSGRRVLRLKRRGPSQRFSAVLEAVGQHVPGALATRALKDQVLLAAAGVGRLPKRHRAPTAAQRASLRVTELKLPHGLTPSADGAITVGAEVILESTLAEPLSKVQVSLSAADQVLGSAELHGQAPGRIVIPLTLRIPSSLLSQPSLSSRLTVLAQAGDEELRRTHERTLVVLPEGGRWLRKSGR